MEIYGQDFNFPGYRRSKMALLTRPTAWKTKSGVKCTLSNAEQLLNGSVISQPWRYQSQTKAEPQAVLLPGEKRSQFVLFLPSHTVSLLLFLFYLRKKNNRQIKQPHFFPPSPCKFTFCIWNVTVNAAGSRGAAIRFGWGGVGLLGQVSQPEWSGDGTCISHDVESNVCLLPCR